jgi:hypothetical protein
MGFVTSPRLNDRVQERGWLIEYYNGSLPLWSFSYEDGSFEDAPANDVVFVHMWYDGGIDVNTLHMCGCDHYSIRFLPDGTWEGLTWVDGAALQTRQVFTPENKHIRFRETAELAFDVDGTPLQDTTGWNIKNGIFVPRPDSLILELENEEDDPIQPGPSGS